MEGDRNAVERQEFQDDFRLAVYQLMQVVENELGDGRHRIRPDDREWRLQRAKTIAKLNELREKLDKTCVAANYGKSVGIGASIVGDITSLVAVLMEFRESSSAQGLKNIGSLVSHSGSLVDGMSSIAESLGSTKYLNDAENILQKDKELSASLGNWVEAWEILDGRIQELFGFDRASEKWILLANVLREFSRIQSVTKDFKLTFEHMKSGKYSTYIATEMRHDAFLKLFSYVEKTPRIPAGIRLGLIGVNRVPAVVKSYQKLTGKEISEKMATIPIEYKAPTVDSVAEYTFLRSIDVAVNFMSLLDVAKVIKKGKSKYSDPLKDIIYILELEFKNMKDL